MYDVMCCMLLVVDCMMCCYVLCTVGCRCMMCCHVLYTVGCRCMMCCHVLCTVGCRCMMCCYLLCCGASHCRLQSVWCIVCYAVVILTTQYISGSKDSSVVGVPDLWLKRWQVQVPAGAVRGFSSPASTFCADSYFGIRSTPMLLQ